jgi:methyltransferase-like protein/SAM-dependent methyltransferase
MNDQFSYDTVPYPSLTFAQTQPDRLATMGTVYGMNPAPPERCRVLELGCGDGANLLSMAYVLPESEFVGIDLSRVHIDDANKTSAKLSISNASFFREDVTEFDFGKFGTFDYIIAHGLFSWVPDIVRVKILDIYQKCLAPQGVGYISYNVYPGCKIREMLWGMMQYEIRNEPAPAQKVAKAIDFVRQLSAAAEGDSVYQTMLRLELESIEERSTSNVFHDDLSEFNQPFYFREFNDLIRGRGLQFLSEAEPAAMNYAKLSVAGQKMVGSFEDLIEREQHLDFIQCRRFRSTLLCRGNVSLERNPSPGIIKDFFISSKVKTESGDVDLKTAASVKFLSPDDAGFEINHPLTKAALKHLGSIWVRSVAFDELIGECCRMLKLNRDELPEEEIDRLSAYLIQLFQAGFVKLHRFQPDFAAQAGEFPKISDFARWQIERGSESVTTLTGLSLKPEYDAVRVLITLLDGTRDRSTLAEAMLEQLEIPESERESAKQQMPKLIESNLARMIEAGLMIR